MGEFVETVLKITVYYQTPLYRRKCLRPDQIPQMPQKNSGGRVVIFVLQMQKKNKLDEEELYA